jgi:hypothetical protein
LTPQHEHITELYARIAKIEKLLSRVLDTQRNCAIMFVDETQDAQGLTRTIPNRAERKAAAYKQLTGDK